MKTVPIGRSGGGGTVSPKSAGTATITAKAGTKSATCTVTVEQVITTVNVESVALNKTTLELTEGADETLTATVKPDNATNKNITWSSNKTDIATVDSNGKITAVKAGSATITVTTEDGAKTATCEVTVKEIKVTGITVTPATLTLMEGKSQTLTATVTPADASNLEVEWASNSTTVATVGKTTGEVTAVKAGTTKIYARSKSDNTIQGYCELTVTPDSSLKGISFDATEVTLERVTPKNHSKEPEGHSGKSLVRIVRQNQRVAQESHSSKSFDKTRGPLERVAR